MIHAVRGSSVVDVIVALVVFHVGLTAVLGTTTLAVRLANEATLQQRATRTTREVMDSLSAFGFTGNGQVSGTHGRIEWTGAASGPLVRVTIRFFPPDSLSSPIREVTAVVRSGP
jgi:hypothetical protein